MGVCAAWRNRSGSIFTCAAVDEQGGGLVDAPLAGIGATDSVDVFDLMPRHAFYN